MSSVGKKSNSKLWRIYSMFLKELKLISNDKFALLLVFVLPTMIMGTMYFAINQGSTIGSSNIDPTKDADALILGLVDLDTTDTFPGEDLSVNFTWYLQTSPKFIVILFDTEQEALEALYFDDIDVYAVLSYGFEGNITNDIPAFVNLHISSTDFDSLSSVSSQFSRVVGDFRYDHGWIQGEIASKNFPEFQPEGASSLSATFGIFMIVFAIFIAVSATAAQAIVGDIPLNRMLLTPATKMEAILAKVLGYFMIGMLQAQFLLVLWMTLFNIDLWYQYLNLNIILGLLSLSGASLGVLISTLVTTRLQANQSFLFLMFGSTIIGTGFLDVGIIDDIFPVSIGRVMMVDIAFKNIAITEFIGDMYVMLLMSLAFIIISWLIFVKKTTLA
ncbi:MAG: ABC transporter permease [Candidatus Thorarchaeota archaeon]|nr:MAG: ABC transporter permease [Candidatus Thorarchaeota archaeon]